MKTLELALSAATAHAIGWTLFHFLWEGLAIALAFAILQSFLSERAAKARYAVGCLALAAMALAPVITFCLVDRTMDGPTPQSLLRPAADLFLAAAPSYNPGGGMSAGAGAGLDQAMPWLAALWLVGAIVMSVRLASAWWRVRRLWTSHLAGVDPVWLERLAGLKSRLGVTRPVRLFQSALVEAPGVFGWLRPVILLPVSVLSGLTPAQLESILAHELAHIRRNDYLVNLAQNILETVLFYHPAVWWVSRRVREERENCCDDLAVEACGNAQTYARALASLEEIRSAEDMLVMAADGGPLLARIRRLIEPGVSKPPKHAKGRRLLWGTLLALVVGVTLWTCDLSGSLPDFRSLHQATARIALLPVREEAGDRDRLGNGSPILQPVRLAVERIRSNTMLYPVIDDLRLVRKWRLEGEQQTYKKLLRQLDVTAIPDAGIISITVRSENAEEAAQIANSIAQHYQNRQLMRHIAVTEGRMSAMESQMERWELNIDEAEGKLSGLRANGDDTSRIRDRLDLLKSERDVWLKKIQELSISEATMSSALEVEILDVAQVER